MKPCNSNLNNLCCTQVQSINTFRITVTYKTFKIYNKLNCKSKCLIYLMECVLCNKQYIGKSETTFNLRLKNHWKDVNKQNLLQADQHFRLRGYNFNTHAKFTLIEQSSDTNMGKELRKYRLKKREGFWIVKLKTLQPYQFNAELNFPNPQYFCISCASVSLKVICWRGIKTTTSHCLNTWRQICNFISSMETNIITSFLLTRDHGWN